MCRRLQIGKHCWERDLESGARRKNGKERKYDRVSKAFADGVKLHPIFLELLGGHVQFSHLDILDIPATFIMM